MNRTALASAFLVVALASFQLGFFVARAVWL